MNATSQVAENRGLCHGPSRPVFWSLCYAVPCRSQPRAADVKIVSFDTSGGLCALPLPGACSLPGAFKDRKTPGAILLPDTVTSLRGTRRHRHPRASVLPRSRFSARGPGWPACPRRAWKCETRRLIVHSLAKPACEEIGRGIPRIPILYILCSFCQPAVRKRGLHSAQTPDLEKLKHFSETFFCSWKSESCTLNVTDECNVVTAQPPTGVPACRSGLTHRIGERSKRC